MRIAEITARIGRAVLGGLLACVCGLAAAGPAHSPTPAVLPLTFESLDSFGADSQSILSLAQDRQGFIWVGTVEGGLYRYDGRTPVKYSNDPARASSLPGGRISALFCDAEGRLWVGSDEGLALFDPLTDGFKRYAPPVKGGNLRIIRRIISDGAQGLWLATWGGLQHFDPATGMFQVFQSNAMEPDAIAHNDINAVALDPEGGVWAATWPAGMDYRPPGKSHFLHMRLDSAEQPDPQLNDVRALRFDAEGTLWIGTDGGLVIWRHGTPWAQRQRVAGPHSRINHIAVDAGGAIWVATRTEGLLRWDAQRRRFQAYMHRPGDIHSLPSNAINAVMEDRSGTLWVGSFTDGVSRANTGMYGFERILPRDVAPESFPSSNFVRSLGAAPDGRLWLGVDDGLALFDPASHQLVRKYTAQPGVPGSLSHNSVYSLYQQPNGPLWIGTSKGLNRYDPATGRFTTVPFRVPTEGFINTIAPGRDGRLWIGTAGSLLHYDPASGASETYGHDPANAGSRSVDDASAVLEDSQGRLWVGDFFRGGGLDVLPRGAAAFQHHRHDPRDQRSLASDKVTCLYEDLYGTIWIGTSRGLHRMVPAADGRIEFHRYDAPGDPGPLMIESIQSDSTGILWIATVKGLSRLDPSSGAFTHYSADDGVTDGMFQGASVRATDGKLYFGSSTGVTAVYPELPLRAPDPPQVAITDIRVFERSLNDGLPAQVKLEGGVIAPRALTLPWSASVLTLEFAALHYAAPRRNSYAYMLEGFDQHWVHVDASRPMATYTNLDPGNYRFLVRATSNKGLDSPIIELPVTITPPLWKTWWFRSIALVLALLAMVAAYRARIRAFKRRASRLETLVEQRTQQLQESNRKLTALSSTDGLTSLANRRSFDEVLEREWARAKRKSEPLTLAMIDVDFFKPYNDLYGHQQGDDCLRSVAGVLATTIKRGTDLAARYGGEEFAFIAPATCAADAMAMAEEVRAALEALALPHQKAPLGYVTVSIGVSVMVPIDAQEAALLLRSADQALYRAKSTGRNRVVLGTGLMPETIPGIAAA
jgi:diguanylate cyclase (GGDEF)-like protein